MQSNAEMYTLHVLTLIRILASHFIHDFNRDNARVVVVGTNVLIEFEFSLSVAILARTLPLAVAAITGIHILEWSSQC